MIDKDPISHPSPDSCLETFEPGQEFGRRYRVFVYVCTNPVTRSFEKCDIEEGFRVLSAFQYQIMAQGLSHHAYAFQAGCMLGCQPRGTTVSIAYADGHPTVFFKNVQEKDVDHLLKTAVMPHTAPI